MFEINDPVVHPQKGAGIVIGVGRPTRFIDKKCYITIRMVGRAAKTTLMLPLESAEEMLRPAISETHLDQVWEALASQPKGLPAQHKKRYKILEERMRTGQTSTIATVVRDLEWRRKQGQHLNVPGERIYKRAMRFLTGELAVSQNIDVPTAAKQVNRVLNENLSSHMAG